MSKHVQSYIVHVRGASDDFGIADAKALERLDLANQAIQAGAIPKDPGISIRTVDPGGGGGPCAPEFVPFEFDVSASGLPEATPRDD